MENIDSINTPSYEKIRWKLGFENRNNDFSIERQFSKFLSTTGWNYKIEKMFAKSAQILEIFAHKIFIVGTL